MIIVWCLQQVHRVLKRLATGPEFRGKTVRKITVTGHSLGGALAMLAGCDIGEWICNNSHTSDTGSWRHSQEGIVEADTVDQESHSTSAGGGSNSTGAGSGSSSSSSSSCERRSSSQQQHWQWHPMGNQPPAEAPSKWPSKVGVITFGAPRVGVRRL
jgi:Lipase (class 3)